MVAAWLLAGAIVALFAAALGRAILHLRGHYFAIASLVVAEVLREITNSATDLTGGGMGLNLPVLAMDVTNQTRLFYYAMFAVAACGARHRGARRPQPTRLRPALHPAERGCRHHARRQRPPLQGAGLRPVGGVSGAVRRHLRLLGQLHRPDRRLRRAVVGEADRHGPAGRRRHGAGRGLWRLPVPAARGAGVAQSARVPRRAARHHRRRPGPVPPHGRPRHQLAGAARRVAQASRTEPPDECDARAQARVAALRRPGGGQQRVVRARAPARSSA